MTRNLNGRALQLPPLGALVFCVAHHFDFGANSGRATAEVCVSGDATTWWARSHEKASSSYTRCLLVRALAEKLDPLLLQVRLVLRSFHQIDEPARPKDILHSKQIAHPARRPQLAGEMPNASAMSSYEYPF